MSQRKPKVHLLAAPWRTMADGSLMAPMGTAGTIGGDYVSVESFKRTGFRRNAVPDHLYEVMYRDTVRGGLRTLEHWVWRERVGRVQVIPNTGAYATSGARVRMEEVGSL